MTTAVVGGTATRLGAAAATALALEGCDSGTREEQSGKSLQWRYMRMYFESSATQGAFRMTDLERGYWLETLETIGLQLAARFRKQGTTIVVYEDQASVLWAYTQIGPPQAGTSGLMGWQTGVGFLLGFYHQGEVHVQQGREQTLEGFGAHLATHLWLGDQTGDGDPSHIRGFPPGSWWLPVDLGYIAEALRLRNQR